MEEGWEGVRKREVSDQQDLLSRSFVLGIVIFYLKARNGDEASSKYA